MSDRREGTTSTNDELWRLYGIAVDEYRFQVNLNWQRLQYFLGLNVAILSVGAGLLRLGTRNGQHLDNTLPGLVFVAGVALSLAAWNLARRQQTYYRAARDTMLRVGARLDVGDLGVATTAGSRGEVRPWWSKVRTVNEAVLATLALLNAGGALYAFLH